LVRRLSWQGGVDDFTIELEDLSRRVGPLKTDQLKPRAPPQPATSNESQFQPNKKRSFDKTSKGNQKKQNGEQKTPPDYICAVCKKTAGHWPQDCPDRTPEQRKLTKEQWIEKSREAKKARLQEKRNKQHSTSYVPAASTSDYRSYLSRAQECGDYFTSTLVHKNRECAIQTVLDSGSDENVLTVIPSSTFREHGLY
jgi:hypothetical protein